jgi:hypothetical protein
MRFGAERSRRWTVCTQVSRSLSVAALLVAAAGCLAVLGYASGLLGRPAPDQPSSTPGELVVTASSPSPTSDPCLSIQPQPDSTVPTSFLARTAADVLRNAPKDPAMRWYFSDLAGVRPGPLGDPRVPRCRIDLLQLGEPLFVRLYPATTGSWLVPIVYQGQTLQTVFVDVDPTGMGRVGGGRGGVIPIPTEAAARAAGARPGDPVVDAQLVFAKPPGCSGALTAVWRLVRASGSVAYFALDVYKAAPPGVLFEEKDMGSVPAQIGNFRYASLGAAC